MNLFDAELETDADDPDGYRAASLRTAALLGGEHIALNIFVLPPGESLCPYHYESGEEEWIIVLTGRPTLRTPAGEQDRVPGRHGRKIGARR